MHVSDKKYPEQIANISLKTNINRFCAQKPRLNLGFL
jgi:hypothetical protein